MAQTTTTWSKGKLLRFAAVTVVLLLLLAEGIGRVVFFLKFRGLGTSVFIQGSPIQVADSATVYNNRAFYVDFEKGFQYNELGMKSSCGDYMMPAKASGDLWVLLLGGSAMEGMGSNKDGAWFDMTNISDHPYDETIAFFLEDRLRRRYPGRRVRVFNAAVSGYTLEQGVSKYRELSKRYDFDWVISMDGVNECDTLEAADSAAERAYSRAYWAAMPFHKFPLNWIVPVTERSALFNMLKQEMYAVRMRARVRRNEAGGFPLRRRGGAGGPAGGSLAGAWPPLQMDSGDERVRRSVGAFLQEERAFAGELEREGKHCLLLMQPYLAFRDSRVLGPEEMALDGYLRQAKNDRYKHAFLKGVYDRVGEDLNIQTMSGVERWRGWVFVDYCHFTKAANERIAGELASFIVSDGKMGIFK